MRKKMERKDIIVNTILEMFEQRGYGDITREDDRITAIKGDGEMIYAYTTIIQKLNVAEINTHISVMNEENVKHGLLVFEGMPTPAVKNVVATSADIDIIIELFKADDLMFNITKHELVPKHIQLSKEDAKKFKKDIGVNIQHLKADDPIARFYNFRKGDIIKIIRKGGIVAYRIVK